MGWVFSTRPLDGLIAGALTGLWLLFLSGGPLAGRFSRAAAYAAGCVATGSIYLIHNNLMTGHAAVPPLDRYLSRLWGKGANSFGFGKSVGPPPGEWEGLDPYHGHSAGEAVLNTLNNLASLQFELFGWGAGSLALVVLFALRGRWSGFDRAMAAVAVVTAAAVAFYWFAGSFYIGPRYWFLAAFPAVYLSARGLAVLAGMAPGLRGNIGAATLVLCAASLFVFLPWRAVTKYHEYENVHATLRNAAANGRFGNAIVLVTDSGDPASYLSLNDPWMRDPSRPVFVKDLGDPQARAIRAAFPDRRVLRFRTGWQRPAKRRVNSLTGSSSR
jgi:hypothetical protein